MKLDDFQKQALKSVAITEKTVAALAHRTLGLSGEAGTVGNDVKKIIRDKQGQFSDDDIAKLEEKLGDVLYYIAVLADYADLTLEAIAEKNILKSQEFLKNRDKIKNT